MIDDIKHMIANDLIYWGLCIMPNCKMKRTLLAAFHDAILDDLLTNPKFKKFL